jgi:hypothetical protein
MSADFLGLPRSSLLGLPLLSWCAIAALLLVGYFLRYSRTGRASTPQAATPRRRITPGSTPGKCSSSASACPARWRGSAVICGFPASPWRMSMWRTVLNCRSWQPV